LEALGDALEANACELAERNTALAREVLAQLQARAEA
jgi:hypothetical protein